MISLKGKKVKRTKTNIWQFVISVFLSFVLMNIFPFTGLAGEKYVFERMWPSLEQPWYFTRPNGLARDENGNIFIADSVNHRVQKFSSNGEFITKWGSEGTRPGDFDNPDDVAIDKKGNVFVAEYDNHRIQKFTSNGEFITWWGEYGTGDGQLINPYGIAVDFSGNVYVADRGNHRIQKFSSNGEFIVNWDIGNVPTGVAIDTLGNVYVTQWGARVSKFTSNGDFIKQWGSSGNEDGQFSYPSGIAIDVSGNIYVADRDNNRIQKFSSTGEFISKWPVDYKPVDLVIDVLGNAYVTTSGGVQKFNFKGELIAKWESGGNGDSEFAVPDDITLDKAGNVYVLDGEIQKFSPDGKFLKRWGSSGKGEGELYRANSLAVSVLGELYIGESGYLWTRIHEFTSDGEFVADWSVYGGGDGKFLSIQDMATDAKGHLYVADVLRIEKLNSKGEFLDGWNVEGVDGLVRCGAIAINNEGEFYVSDAYYGSRIYKFSPNGEFITAWGSEGTEDGMFDQISSIAVDTAGNVYVLDKYNDCVQIFDSNGVFLTRFGNFGSSPGFLNFPTGIAVSEDGKIYISDGRNKRIQVFSQSSVIRKDKAIIVAGSGPYATNTLWDATQMCANYAYRALTYQGYTRDTIYYLSADTDLDLDGDGSPDVDADATNSNLEYALKTWAADADNLFIYMVGHGGEGTFQMGQYELLDAAALDGWMDAAQQGIPDFLVMVYDACHSGSFLPYLVPPAGKTRIVASSAGPNEPAVFQADGGLSFGFQFFAYLFNGGSFYDSYLHGLKSVEGAYDYKQTPHIEGNGNGVGNEKSDKEIAQSINLGNETKTAGDIPQIESVSQPQTLAEGETSAFIHAQNVVDTNGIQEVFAVITPPDYSSGSPDNPVTDLPTINLTSVGNNNYSGTYNGFTVEGVYNVAVFARDGKGVLSLPYQTSVTVSTTTDCLAVGAGLGIQVPCVDYNGNLYGFMLDFHRNADDLSGYYWKMVMDTLTTGTGSDCIPIGADLSMPMDCVSYNGTQYGFTLRFYNNPYDTSGYYWKMDMSTLVVK